ncbi:MAG TPA: nucleoside triphosphate pyrophosphohydrolase family protein [Saprospiraceae bacterium]|nr:nucleoside triphosphate pyrophosphohydrolase family protein [Saprospiraceae bacterium]
MTFDEAQALNGVAKFHRTFGLPVIETPAIPSEDRCKLRISLLAEELQELKDALENNDLVEAADALADLQYVLSGAILELGLGSKFSALFDEVQRSNMSKTCKTYEEAIKTQEYYLATKATDSYIVEKEGEYLVYRKEDSKVLKSINYSAAEVAKVVLD